MHKGLTLTLKGKLALNGCKKDEDCRESSFGNDDSVLTHDDVGKGNKCIICWDILETTNRSLTVEQMKEFGTCMHAKNVCCNCFLALLHTLCPMCPMCRHPVFCADKEGARVAITLTQSVYES